MGRRLRGRGSQKTCRSKKSVPQSAAPGCVRKEGLRIKRDIPRLGHQSGDFLLGLTLVIL